MSANIATVEDIERIVDSKLEPVKQDLMRAIQQIGKPERMTLQDAANEWGVTKITASRRLKQLYRAGKITKIDFDSQPITLNRKEFFEAIN